MANGGEPARNGATRIWSYLPLLLTIGSLLVTLGVTYQRLDRNSLDLADVRSQLSIAHKDLSAIEVRLAAMAEIIKGEDDQINSQNLRIDRIVTYLAPSFSARSKE